MGGGAVNTKNIELPTINTSASKVQSSTEQSNSYTSNIVHINRGTLSIKEIPQSVVVVTRQRLDDQNLQTLAQAMRQTIGATIVPYRNGVEGFYMRGYEVDQYQFDGLKGISSAFSSSFDTAIFDHIEVLKGPAGLLQGAAEPSGTVNMVRKRALKKLNASAAFFGGSYDSYREEADVSIPLAQEGRFRGRLVAAQDNRKSFIDEVYVNKSVLYGTLEYDFDTQTTLSIGATYQGGNSVTGAGLPSIKDGGVYNISRSTFLGDKWNRQTEDRTRYFVDLEHRLNNGGEIRIAFNALNEETYEKTSAWSSSYPDALGNVQTQQDKFDRNQQDRAIDAYITTPFQLFGRHNILVGISHTSNTVSYQFIKSSQLLTKNLFHPTHDSPEPDWSKASISQYPSKTQEDALYGQLRLKFFNVALIGGIRLSWWEDKLDTKLKFNAKATPYAGLIYDITPTYSIYASFAQVFKPQSNKTFDNKAINPRTGNQYEIGMKAGWLEDKLNAQAAFFWIDEQNRALSDPEHSGFSLAMGEARSLGGDIELTGEIFSFWDISMGYSYVKTKYVKADPKEQGRILAPNTPEHSFKLWNRHNISHWKIGWGVIVSGPIHSQTWLGVDREMQGSYAIVSAMLGYKLNDNLEVNLNIDNAFDHKYYARADGWTRQNHYGDPRSFMLSIRARY